MADFTRLSFLDEPAIRGAEWWQKSVRGEVGRRAALIGAGVVGLSAVGLSGLAIHSCTKDTDTVVDKPALEMQRRFGWSFGANGEPLTLTAEQRALMTSSAGEAQRARLTRLALPPTTSALKPYYQSALLEVSTATPTAASSADPSPMTPFTQAFLPLEDDVLGDAFRAGLALAAMFRAIEARPTLVLDLPGAFAIAIAAGLADTFEPVLMMPNWPHPRGVVHAHQALAALCIFQDRFTMAAGVRTRHDLGAAFVLDSERAANVVDVGTQFDNRYLAALPPIDTLRALDATHVFYVRPSTSAVDPSDVLPRLTEYDKGGLPVRKIALDELTTRAAPAANVTNNPLPVPRELPEPYATLASARPELAYAGAYDPVSVFRASYLGAQGKAEGQAHRWRIAPAAAPTPPSNIGVIPVVMSGAGLIVGAEMARRSGSWARGFGGGG